MAGEHRRKPVSTCEANQNGLKNGTNVRMAIDQFYNDLPGAINTLGHFY